jgi:hypothetical protein
MLKDNPMIVNYYKGKIEYARKLKRDQGKPDDLTREELEPILKQVLGTLRSNVLDQKALPKNTDEILVMVKETGVAPMFGLRDSELGDVVVPSQQGGAEQGIPPEIMQMLMAQQQGQPQAMPPQMGMPITAPMPRQSRQTPMRMKMGISQPKAGGAKWA